MKLRTPEGASSLSVSGVPSEKSIFARNFANFEISLDQVAPVQAKTRERRFHRIGEQWSFQDLENRIPEVFPLHFGLVIASKDEIGKISLASMHLHCWNSIIDIVLVEISVDITN